MIKEFKRKIYFDPKYRRIKRYTLTFHCALFNADLSGCNMTCPFCPASKYRDKKTEVVNIKNEECDIYIGRGTKWGNKYIIGVDGNRKEVIEKYKRDKINDMRFRREVQSKLKGRKIGCHCKPLACHGDVLVDIAEGNI